MHEGGARQRLGEPFAELPVDVHCAARGEVDDALLALRRAVGRHAVGHRLPRLAHDRRAAARAARRQRPALRLRLGPSLDDHLDDLRDHVAGALDDDGVADPDVLALDLILIMYCRAGDGDAADATGSRTAKGVTAPVRPDADRDVAAAWSSLLGRELVGDGPARELGGPPSSLHRRAIDLDHRAVDLVLDACRRAAMSASRPPSGVDALAADSGTMGKPCSAR